jgi:hypothetical protein
MPSIMIPLGARVLKAFGRTLRSLLKAIILGWPKIPE